ncbi:MAG: phosphopantetheine-binding protein [Rikenellaceae bacterium]|nr:phosphopantetheine-binding protein [Rikenellaceae bacterium]
MDNKDTILETIASIVTTVTGKKVSTDYLINSSDPMYWIISDSVKALQFVVLLEEEFEIEFDDDEIDFDFFSKTEQLVDCIFNHLN